MDKSHKCHDYNKFLDSENTKHVGLGRREITLNFKHGKKTAHNSPIIRDSVGALC
jgi:hypothetical protein